MESLRMFGLPQRGKGAEMAEIEFILCSPLPLRPSAAESKVPPAFKQQGKQDSTLAFRRSVSETAIALDAAFLWCPSGRLMPTHPSCPTTRGNSLLG
jgi:hypothetical protein